MKRLPHVGRLTEQILERVAAVDTVKIAAIKDPDFTVPVAKEIHKLAQALRTANSNTVTHADVRKFAQQLTRHTG